MEPWSREERARRLGLAEQKESRDAIAGLVGWVLGIVILILLVAGLGALVVKLWRMAVA